MVINHTKPLSMLNHIALQINQENDLKNFYNAILGFEELRRFELNENLSSSIFGLKKKVDVILIRKENLTIELFLTDVIIPFQGYNHTCLNVNDREQIIQNCRDQNYEVIEIPREKSNLCFVKDHTGNLFELKA